MRDLAYLAEEPRYHAGLYGVRPDRRRVADVLDRLDLGNARFTRIASCSKGMKQKVGIAQCLRHQPRLLLLDEPMRGLDPVAVRDFRDILTDMHRQGVTIVLNSHMLSEVEQVASRAVKSGSFTLPSIGSWSR